MKRGVLATAVLLFCLVGLIVPACGQVVYNNGPINGTTDAWTINFGFSVSNSFHCCQQSDGANGTVNGIDFGAWVFPGDVLQSAEVLIGTSEFAGDIFDATVNFTQSACVGNQYGFNVCTESGTFGPINLSAGDYWVTLENAVVNTGDPIYWDENSGPSQASENSVGTIPSESFTLFGNVVTTTSSGTVPEPSSALLFGSGVLGALGLLRGRFMR